LVFVTTTLALQNLHSFPTRRSSDLSPSGLYVPAVHFLASPVFSRRAVMERKRSAVSTCRPVSCSRKSESVKSRVMATSLVVILSRGGVKNLLPALRCSTYDNSVGQPSAVWKRSPPAAG